MTALIHFTVNGIDDSIVISAESPEEIRAKAESELATRGGVDPWSEIL